MARSAARDWELVLAFSGFVYLYYLLCFGGPSSGHESPRVEDNATLENVSYTVDTSFSTVVAMEDLHGCELPALDNGRVMIDADDSRQLYFACDGGFVLIGIGTAILFEHIGLL